MSIDTRIITPPAKTEGKKNNSHPPIGFFRRPYSISARKQVQRLDTMTLPAVLEPVRSYLLAYLRFSLDLERARFRYIKDGDVPPLRELFAATCRSSKPEDASMFANLAAAPQTARPAASGHGWHNRMIDCRASQGSYPIASWQAFVRNYGLNETRVDSQ